MVEVLLSLGLNGGVEIKVSRTQKEKVLRETEFFGWEAQPSQDYFTCRVR